MDNKINTHIRYEVWVSQEEEDWRFNACFDSMERAAEEMTWYQKLPRYRAKMAVRTTRYQRSKNMFKLG